MPRGPESGSPRSGYEWLAALFEITADDMPRLLKGERESIQKIDDLCAFLVHQRPAVQTEALDITQDLLVYFVEILSPQLTHLELIAALNRHAGTLIKRVQRRPKSVRFNPHVHDQPVSPDVSDHELYEAWAKLAKALAFKAMPKLTQTRREWLLSISRQLAAMKYEEQLEDNPRLPFPIRLTSREVKSLVAALRDTVVELVMDDSAPPTESELKSLRHMYSTLSRKPGRGNRDQNHLCAYVVRYFASAIVVKLDKLKEE